MIYPDAKTVAFPISLGLALISNAIAVAEPAPIPAPPPDSEAAQLEPPDTTVATTMQEWVAQIQAAEAVNGAIVQSPSGVSTATARITNLQLNRVDSAPTPELEIILETEDGRPLAIDASRFRADGNTLIADLFNVILALPNGSAFVADNPTDDIARVQVVQRDTTHVRLSVTGKTGLPTTDIILKTGGLAYTLAAASPTANLPDEEEITVVGTRTPRPVRLTPGSISVIGDREIDQQLVRNLRDLFRYEPNVSVGNNRRYGLQDINIRGLGGNRVLILNDGIRLPTQFQFGTPSLGRDYVDIETLQRVEVVRGPASALYGSDALGGVVSFKTIDPIDLLDRFNRQTVLTTLSTNVETVNSSWVNTGLVAFRSGKFAGLLGYTRRDGLQAEVPIGNEFVDSRTNARDNWLGKLVYQINPQHKLTVTTEIFRNQDRFVVAPITAANLLGPTGFRGQDESLDLATSRDRFSLTYTYSNPDRPVFLTGLQWQLYSQNAETTELRVQDFSRIAPIGFPTDRRRLRNLRNTFLDRVIGGELQVQGKFQLGSVLNRLTFGVDVSSTRNERVRDGQETRFNLAGTPALVTKVVGADNFPVKDFPDSDTLRLGIYLQNEIELTKTLTLIPGVRFDSYQLNTQIDALYLRNPGATAVGLSASAVSPSLGLVWQATPQFTILARYARGFRAPLYSEINSGFTNLTSPGFRYKTLSNPNLQPETSDTFELGLRGNFQRFQFGLTGFYNDYSNFIETNAAVGVDFTIVPGFPVNLFQSRNLGRASTYGLELTSEYRFGNQPHGFSLLAGAGLTIGDDLTNNRPLESVDPFKFVVGLRYRAAENRWGADLIATLVGDPRLRSDRPVGAYTPQGYTVVDLIGYYNITPLLTLNFGIFNLLNDQYFLYSDVRPLINSPTPFDIARFAQPSISLRAGLTWRF